MSAPQRSSLFPYQSISFYTNAPHSWQINYRKAINQQKAR